MEEALVEEWRGEERDFVLVRRDDDDDDDLGAKDTYAS